MAKEKCIEHNVEHTLKFDGDRGEEFKIIWTQGESVATIHNAHNNVCVGTIHDIPDMEDMRVPQYDIALYFERRLNVWVDAQDVHHG